MKPVVSTEAVPPRRLRPDVRRDLETITLKCLEENPTGRYADSGALAVDRNRFSAGRPIAARPVGLLGRLWRWRRRNQALAATAAALVLTFVLGSPALLGLWRQARGERPRAEVERYRAETSPDRAVSAVDYGRNAKLTGKLPTALNPHQLRERRRRFDAGAIAVLRQAAAAGFKDAARLRRESIYEPLRAHPDFAAIRADIEFPEHPFSGDRG